MGKRWCACLMICVLAVAMLLVPWGADAGQATKPLTKITVLAPGPSAVTTYNFFVAVGEGYFKDEGLDAVWEAVDGSSQVLQGVAAGKAQIGRPGPGPVLAARGRGLDVVFIYNLYPKSIFGLVTKAGSSYKVPGDLKGKVVGVGTADGAEVAFVRPMFTDGSRAIRRSGPSDRSAPAWPRRDARHRGRRWSIASRTTPRARHGRGLRARRH